MNGKDLLIGFNFVDEQLIEEAAEYKNIKRNLGFAKILFPMAAGFAVIITAFSLWVKQNNITPNLPGNDIPPFVSKDTQNDNSKYTLYFNKIDSQMAASLYIEGHFWEDLTSKQAASLLPGLSEKYPVEGITNYSHTGGNTKIFSIDAKVKVEGKNDIKITIAPNKIVKCYKIDGESTLSEIEGIAIEAGIFKTDKNSKGQSDYIYHAEFKIEDIAYYAEFSGEKNDKAFFTDIVADIILGGKADLSQLANPKVPILREDYLTESEAYAETDFGKYLLKIPDNYQFNEAVRYINQDSNGLFASWSQGYDDVSVTISKRKEEDTERIISVKDTELYDMSLYSIPWSDSMPKDKAYIIENPIFRIEELTLDVVKMRGYTREKEGGSNCVNMNFSVLYEDDVVIEIRAEGLSAAYLLNELTTLPKD